MPQPYAPLFHTHLSPRAGYATPAPQIRRVSVDSPAVEVMTDLQRVVPITVTAEVSIELANQRMMASGARLLLVIDDNKWSLGLITASDILGEKPLQNLRRRGGTFGDILVQDIMTPQEHLDVLRYADVLHARVGDLIETLKHIGRQHALLLQFAEIAVRHWLELLFQSIDLLVGVVVFAEQLGEVGVIVLEPVNFGVIFRKILIDNMTNAIHIQDPPVIVEDEEPNGMTACRGPRRLSLTQSRSQTYMDADPRQPRVLDAK